MNKTFPVTLSAIAHLIVMGVFGWVPIVILITLLSTGVSTIPALGFGLLLLWLLVWCMRGFGTAERARLSSLYGASFAAPPREQVTTKGLAGWFSRLWKGLTDPTELRTIGHLALATLLGAVAFTAAYLFAAGISLLVGTLRLANDTIPLFWGTVNVAFPVALVTAIALIIVAPLILFLIGRIHHELSESLGTYLRRADLETQLREQQVRTTGAVTAAEVERHRIERDLHDGVQPRLVSLGMTLGMAKSKMQSDPEAAAALLEEAHQSTKLAMTELRQLARGIHPAVLSDRGLDAALPALAARSPIPVTLRTHLPRRTGDAAEAAIYFAVAESLTNAAKHSEAEEADVEVIDNGTALVARIIDKGRGGARQVPGGGIDGLAGRVAAAGGNLTVTSPVGGPTIVEVTVPCES